VLLVARSVAVVDLTWVPLLNVLNI
jgi:hypothetical protein